MRFSLFALAAIPALVAGEACVVSGPAGNVTAVKGCCFAQGGKWYQFYAVQAICVYDVSKKSNYLSCVKAVGEETTCIPGEGPGGAYEQGTQPVTLTFATITATLPKPAATN